MPDVLVTHASIEGHTERIAQRIATLLRSYGHRVDLAPAGAGLDLSGYAGIIVGASVHYGRHPAHLRTLLRNHRTELAARPGAFFSVSLSAKERYAEKFLRQVGWRPHQSATFAGALQYRKYGRLKRAVMIVFATLAGHDTDTSRNYEYTNWEAVDGFATAFSQELISAS